MALVIVASVNTTDQSSSPAQRRTFSYSAIHFPGHPHSPGHGIVPGRWHLALGWGATPQPPRTALKITQSTTQEVGPNHGGQGIGDIESRRSTYSADGGCPRSGGGIDGLAATETA